MTRKVPEALFAVSTDPAVVAHRRDAERWTATRRETLILIEITDLSWVFCTVSGMVVSAFVVAMMEGVR